MSAGSLGAVLLIALSAQCLAAQSLPRSIRGYRVYQPRTTMQVATGRNDAKGSKVSIKNVKLVSLRLGTVHLSAEAVLTDIGVTGSVDFLVFRDINVNGLPIQIEEYRQAFNLKENGAAPLPKPLELSIPMGSAVTATYKELTDREPHWIISGTALVFARFRRFGMTFKRVVPVAIRLTIDNPTPRR